MNTAFRVVYGLVCVLMFLIPAPLAKGVSFERLRALGDSLTINTQGGIVADYRTQVRGWVPLLAAQAGAEMKLPLLSEMSLIGQQRREDYPDYQHTYCLAYSGVSVDDTFMKIAPEIPWYSWGWAWNHLDLILADRPGYTMVSALQEDNPTFVVGFLGSNDFMSRVMARGTMMEGIPTLGLMDEIDPLNAEGLRPQELFRSDFETVVSSLYKPGVGMCFGTLPTLPDIPGIMTKDELTAFLGVNSLPNDCYTNYTVAAGVRGGLQSPEIFADDRNHYTPAELQSINEAIAGYNNTIREAGANPAHPFAVVETPIQDPGTIDGSLHVNGWQINNRIFVDNLGKPRATIMTTDGVHMTDIGNALCAQAYIRAINAYYGTSIPELNEAQLTAILNNDRFADNDGDGSMEGISCNVAFLTLNFVYPNETGDSDEVPRNAKILTTQVIPPASGYVAPSTEGPEYFEGSVVTLTAYPVPAANAIFVGWTGDVPGGSTSVNPLTITMDAHKNIVAVFDVSPPEITCPPDKNPDTDSGACQAFAVDWTGEAVITDDTAAPDSIIVTQTPAPGTLLRAEENPHTITLTGTDQVGRINQCAFSVNVVDREGPQIICPEDKFLTVEAGMPGLSAPDWTREAVVSDNCSEDSSIILTQTPQPGTPLEIADSPHAITLTAEDAAGNRNVCVFSVILEACAEGEVFDEGEGETTDEGEGEVQAEGEGESEGEGEVEPQPIITLFNTGVDNSGALLPDDFVDPHYIITSGTDPVWNGPEAYASSAVPTAWNLSGSDSRWITPRYPTPPVESGYYRYQTTFNLTGLDPSTASISGRFSADNYLEKILLNGVEVEHVTGTFNAWFDFTVPEGSAFVEGINTLVFMVMNTQDDIGANHSGLRVELAGWAMPQVSVEGEGETPVEGEGEVPVEGEGETPNEGETPVEGEGEVPVEGEGEVPVEGEGETPNEGEMPVEGEGEVPVEGEGEVPVEGEGETPNEGEMPVEGEGETPVEGEGETNITVWYVDQANSSGNENGASWETAYRSIQAAVDAAAIAGGEVWVAAGTYTGSGETVLTMRPGVYLYGGFAGVETSREERNWTANETTVSGQFARRCVVGADNTVLDGFIISGGGAYYGGGMYNDHASPAIANCRFASNYAQGGDAVDGGCTGGFGGHGYGGALYNTYAFPTIINCVFWDNHAIGGQGGDATCCDQPRVSGNGGNGMGGAIFNDHSLPSIINCTFYNNKAQAGGPGGLPACYPNLYTPRFGYPGAANGGAIAGNASLVNCILWNNIPNEYSGEYGVVADITYSDVRFGMPGTGNMSADPLFVDGAAGNLQLSPESPCVDAGSGDGAPELDLPGVSRPQCLEVDMGAYEYAGPCDTPRQATIPGLFNTGVDDLGNVIADDAVDPHWELVASADPAWDGPEVYKSSIHGDEWTGNGYVSAWVTPRYPNAVVAKGTYQYQITFDLTGRAPETASITGRFCVDSALTDIRLNGVSMEHAAGGWRVYTNFTIPQGSPFVDGLNTLVFVLNNSDSSASGFRAEVAGSALRIPGAEGEGEEESVHPADLNADWRMVISEAIAYLAGWQQGSNPLSYAIRAAYLWQNGEAYHYISGEAPPMCWVPAP